MATCALHPNTGRGCEPPVFSVKQDVSILVMQFGLVGNLKHKLRLNSISIATPTLPAEKRHFNWLADFNT